MSVEVLVGAESEIGFFTFDGWSFEASFDSIGSAKYLTSTGEFGESSLVEVLNRFSELSGEDEYIRAGFQFYDLEAKEDRGFVADIAGIDFEDGDYIVRGRVVPDVEDGGGEDLDEIIGDALQGLHNDFMELKKGYWLGVGAYSVGYQVQINVDSFTLEEFADFVPGDALVTEHKDVIRLPETGQPLNYRPNALVLPGSQDSLSQQAYGGSFSLIDISESWREGGVGAGVSLKATPSVDVSMDFPDSWYKYLYPSEYKANLELKLDWSASASLDTGTSQGEITFLDKTFNGPGKTIPIAYGSSIGIETNANLKASAVVDGLSSRYTYGASQTLGVKYSLSTNGLQKQSLNTPIKFTKPVFTKITGASLDFSVTPSLEIKLGFMIPSEFPAVGGKSLATLDGTLSFPVSLDGSVSSGKPSAYLEAKGVISSDLKFLEFWNGGWSYPIASYQFFDGKTGNLFA